MWTAVKSCSPSIVSSCSRLYGDGFGYASSAKPSVAAVVDVTSAAVVRLVLQYKYQV